MPDHSPEPHGRSSTRSTISIWIKPTEGALIDRAAAIQGKSRTDFMLDASRWAVEETLLDQTLLRLDRATYDRFVELLDAPPRPNAQLRKLSNQGSMGLSGGNDEQVSRPELLTAAHDLAAFACGEPTLDDWQRRRANHLSGVSRS